MESEGFKTYFRKFNLKETEVAVTVRRRKTRQNTCFLCMRPVKKKRGRRDVQSHQEQRITPNPLVASRHIDSKEVEVFDKWLRRYSWKRKKRERNE